MKSNLVQEQYNSLSYFYNVLYAGFESTFLEEIFIDEHQQILSNLKPNAKILDASCGNGIQATALAKEGFNITATDISEDMLELAKNTLQVVMFIFQ